MPRLPILYLVAWRAPRDERGAVDHGIKAFQQFYCETLERFLCRMGEFARQFHTPQAWAAIYDARTYRQVMEYGTRFADLPPMPLPLKKQLTPRGEVPRGSAVTPRKGPRQSALPQNEEVKSA